MDRYSLLEGEMYESMGYELLDEYIDTLLDFSHEKEIISSFNPDTITILDQLETIVK